VWPTPTGDSAHAPTLSAFGLLDGYSFLPGQSAFQQLSVSRQRHRIIRREPQHDHFYLFR
jgi:hypothetical protein